MGNSPEHYFKTQKAISRIIEEVVKFCCTAERGGEREVGMRLDKPPNKGQVESTRVYTLYRKSPLKEDNLSTKDKKAGPEGVLIKSSSIITSSHFILSFFLQNEYIVIQGEEGLGLSSFGVPEVSLYKQNILPQNLK